MIVADVTVIGAVVAVAYVSVVGSVLWWMLHIPQAGGLEQQVQRVTRETQRYTRILVPIQGDRISDRLVALASQMAKFRGATMDVIYIIEVPLQLPLSASMEQQEKFAADAFARARKIADRYDVKISTRIERARQSGPAIVRYAVQSNADVVLMGDVPFENKRGTQFARSVEYVFENAPSEVILARPSREGHA